MFNPEYQVKFEKINFAVLVNVKVELKKINEPIEARASR